MTLDQLNTSYQHPKAPLCGVPMQDSETPLLVLDGQAKVTRESSQEAAPSQHKFWESLLPNVNPYPKVSIWGADFTRVDMRQAVELADRVVQCGQPEYFITANLNYLMLTHQDARLAEVNRHCCCILADGHPIVARSRLMKNPLPSRVAGADLIVQLAQLAEEKGYKIYFLGGEPGIGEAAAAELKHRFPKLCIAGTYSPPFRQLTLDEQNQMIQAIQLAKTDILLVAFGQPKGELWIYQNLSQLKIPLSIQLGASFDFLAGKARRAPRFWQVIGCEWLYRAASDPKRLLPRYWQNLVFLLRVLFSEVVSFFRFKPGCTELGR